ncbi:tail completion or Neck1 protein [Vibrio phage K367 g1]
MINIKVDGLQQVQNRIRKEIEKIAKNKTVLVGIHEDAPPLEGEDITMAQLGAVLHFGNQRIPARPWLDVGVRSGSADYLDIIENNSDDLDNALNMIGNIAVGKVQQYMTELQDPPNAPSTVKKKGSSNPLIDTGALRQSVTYSIIDGKPEEGIG